MDQIPDKTRFFVLLLIIIALEAILFSAGNFKLEKKVLEEREYLRNLENTLDELPILAKAVSVYNLDQHKKLYGKNDEVVMPIASLAKIMTVITALNSSKNSDVLSISSNAVEQNGDYGLLMGEKWRIEDVAKFTLISSANDGAYALAEHSGENFLEKMNVKARKIGMDHVLFSNFTGLDSGVAMPGAFASAADVNTMIMYAWRARPEIFSITTQPELNLASLSGFTHNFKNTNVMVGKIPSALFSKTGYTELAEGNLAVMFMNKDGDILAVTVLGSTFEGRFSDMEKLVNTLYNL